MDKKKSRGKEVNKYIEATRPTKKEITAFATGFNSGWKSCKEVFGKLLFISNLPEEVVKGLSSALEDVKAGRYIILVNDKELETSQKRRSTK